MSSRPAKITVAFEVPAYKVAVVRQAVEDYLRRQSCGIPVVTVELGDMMAEVQYLRPPRAAIAGIETSVPVEGGRSRSRSRSRSPPASHQRNGDQPGHVHAAVSQMTSSAAAAEAAGEAAVDNPDFHGVGSPPYRDYVDFGDEGRPYSYLASTAGSSRWCEGGRSGLNYHPRRPAYEDLDAPGPSHGWANQGGLQSRRPQGERAMRYYADAIPPPQSVTDDADYAEFLQFKEYKSGRGLRDMVNATATRGRAPRTRATRGRGRGGKRGRPRKQTDAGINLSSSDEDDDFMCLLCHGPHGNRKLHCGHWFHKKCIRDAIKTAKVCPYCNVDLDEGQLRQL